MSTWTPKRTPAECEEIMCAVGSFWEREDMVIKGRPVRVFKNQPASLRDFWEGTRVFGPNDYIVYEDERFTFAQAHERVEAYANLLASCGVGKGDVVSIIMRNYPEWIFAFYAIQSLGAIAAVVNAWLLPDSLQFCVNHVGSVVAIVDAERADALVSVLPKLLKGGLQHVFVTRETKLPAGMKSLAGSLRDCKMVARPKVSILPEDYATIFFTSGTTGMPKGVLSTNRQYLTNFMLTRVAGLRAILRDGGEMPTGPDPNAPPSCVLLTVPLFHVTGNQSLLALPTGTGAKLVLLKKWDLEKAVEVIRREQVTIAGGVPFQVLSLIDSDLANGNNPLLGFTFGGAPSPLSLPATQRARMSGTSSSNAYGLTETNAIATSHSGEDYLLRPGSCGLPSPVNEVKIVDMTSGKILAAKGVGEIYIKGPNVAEAYWNNEKATKEAFSADGWFQTGDIGYLDEGGWLFILDRAKELIIRGGENISTITVENALYTDLRVQDAAVVPVPDYMLGELVAAIVTVKPTALKNPPTEAELMARVASQLPKHCTPVMVIIAESIPRNANGKIVKKDIKESLKVLWEERTKKVKAAAKL